MKKNGKTSSSKNIDMERETRVLLEKIHSDVKTIAEGQVSGNDRLTRIENAVAELVGVKSDVETIKTAVIDTNQGVKTIEKKIDDHEIRITKLEEKVFV